MAKTLFWSISARTGSAALAGEGEIRGGVLLGGALYGGGAPETKGEGGKPLEGGTPGDDGNGGGAELENRAANSGRVLAGAHWGMPSFQTRASGARTRVRKSSCKAARSTGPQD